MKDITQINISRELRDHLKLFCVVNKITMIKAVKTAIKDFMKNYEGKDGRMDFDTQDNPGSPGAKSKTTV